MPLAASISRTRFRCLAPLVLASGLAFTGCGEGEGQVAYSQDFPKPEGATVKADPNAELGRGELRRQEIEESKQEAAAKGKGKKRRS
ncbi:hypothetical protein [Paludisphaera soli]|uniref:hypothetical protein n=1 Tax=Paludisphaera soli TaxID=2712865 RepID=UPI0013EBB3B0|nr:hypothetical protein [Paludisphaera soli]